MFLKITSKRQRKSPQVFLSKAFILLVWPLIDRSDQIHCSKNNILVYKMPKRRKSLESSEDSSAQNLKVIVNVKATTSLIPLPRWSLTSCPVEGSPKVPWAPSKIFSRISTSTMERGMRRRRGEQWLTRRNSLHFLGRNSWRFQSWIISA